MLKKIFSADIAWTGTIFLSIHKVSEFNLFFLSFWCCKSLVSFISGIYVCIRGWILCTYVWRIKGDRLCAFWSECVLTVWQVLQRLELYSLILDQLDLEAVSVAKGTAMLVLVIPVKIRLLFHLVLQSLQNDCHWDSEHFLCIFMPLSQGSTKGATQYKLICIRSKCDLGFKIIISLENCK